MNGKSVVAQSLGRVENGAFSAKLQSLNNKFLVHRNIMQLDILLSVPSSCLHFN